MLLLCCFLSIYFVVFSIHLNIDVSWMLTSLCKIYTYIFILPTRHLHICMSKNLLIQSGIHCHIPSLILTLALSLSLSLCLSHSVHIYPLVQDSPHLHPCILKLYGSMRCRQPASQLFQAVSTAIVLCSFPMIDELGGCSGCSMRRRPFDWSSTAI